MKAYEYMLTQTLVPVMLLCDANRVLSSDYSEIRMIGC